VFVFLLLFGSNSLFKARIVFFLMKRLCATVDAKTLLAPVA